MIMAGSHFLLAEGGDHGHHFGAAGDDQAIARRRI